MCLPRKKKAAPRYTVEQTSDAFADPFIIRDNAIPEGQDGQYYDVGGIYQTFETEEEAQGYADTLNRAERETEQNGEPAPSETVEKQDNSDLIGRKITIDNRSYLIESVGEISGECLCVTSHSRITWASLINRVEKISYIRRLLGQQAEKDYRPKKKRKLPQSLLRKLWRNTLPWRTGFPMTSWLRKSVLASQSRNRKRKTLPILKNAEISVLRTMR